MPTFDCSAILFDLDGVLVDSTASVARHWSLWARAHNIDPEKAAELAHGRRTIETVRLLLPNLDAEAETRRIEQDEADDNNGVVVMPGAAELVASIPLDRWCVVTSGTRRLATSRLRVGKLTLPKVLVTADDVTNGKPHPEPYLKGAESLGMNPAECLVIEDAPAGIAAAHAAGMKVVALTTTYPTSALSDADSIATRLSLVGVSNLEHGLRVEVAQQETVDSL